MMLFNAFSILFFYIQPFGIGESILGNAAMLHASAVAVAIHHTILQLLSKIDMMAAKSVCKRGCSQQ
jgi:hypothetical protein